VAAAEGGAVERMLTIGLNHVATLTNDAARLHAFYREVFEAEVVRDAPEVDGQDAVRLSIIKIGPYAELNVFQIDGNTEADRQVPMFGRGRIDHFALQAGSLSDFETIRERLMDRGSCDSFVTDFGPVLSLFFRDPDGLEGEVCVDNPDAVPGVTHPPGTPASRYTSAPD
jgi:catechol 2,3-dioxygenase-like lactoylglutathione lyase family enzyme